MSVYLPRVPSRLPAIHRHPRFDRVVRLIQAVVWAAVDGDGGLAPWRFGRVHFTRSFSHVLPGTDHTNPSRNLQAKKISRPSLIRICRNFAKAVP
jgi:hypothetical protein